MSDILDMQAAVASRFGVEPMPPQPGVKVGIASNVRAALDLLNAMRHPPEGDTSGRYIWAGEDLSDDPDFFVPLHVSHVADWCPALLPYLALPPGWRVLLAPGHEDVWFDETLL
jgi:hypothetical protein